MATSPIALVEQQQGMTEDELAQFLDENEQRSVSYLNSELAAEQEKAINAYYRRPYGDERVGRSQVVDGTVAVTIDNAVAAILKPFVSAETSVEYEPVGPEDEEAAAQATEFVNYVFQKECNGFLVLHDWIKEALLLKLGIVKVYWEDKTRPRQEQLQVDAMQAEMLAGEGAEVYGPDESGLFTALVTRDYEDGCIRVENVPVEEYRISPLARPGCTPPYEAHVRNVPRSDVIDMGFDADMVYALSAYTKSATEDARKRARYRDEDAGMIDVEVPGDKSRELIQIAEEYALIDYDGDGISELRKIIRCGDVILWNEEVDEGPFARLCPIPMPHKITGLSLADVVLDDQRVSTVVLRQSLDNLYLANSPRVIVPRRAMMDDGSTIDDLMNPAPGAPIRTDAEPIVPFAIPFVADKSFAFLDYISTKAEQKSGVSQVGQGIDQNALKKSGQSTATEMAIIESGKNARVEMIARIFAETGIKDLFRKMLRLFVAHQPRAKVIRLRNEWVPIDPRSWNAEMDVTIAVGLGVGNKVEQMTQAQVVLEAMNALGQTPYASLINGEKVYNALKRLFTAAGIKNTDQFLVDPPRDEQGNAIEPEQPPDPEMMKVQAQAQLDQAKLQGEQQMNAAKLEMQRDEAELKLQLQRDEAAAEIELARQKAEAEFALAQAKMNQEIELAERRMQMEERLAERKAATAEKQALSKNRPGGALDK